MAHAGTYTNGRGAAQDWPHAEQLRGTNPPGSAFHTQEPMPDYRDLGKAADRTMPRFSEEDVERLLGKALHEYRQLVGGAPAVAPGPRNAWLPPVARKANRIGSRVFFWSGVVVFGVALGYWLVASAVAAG